MMENEQSNKSKLAQSRSDRTIAVAVDLSILLQGMGVCTSELKDGGTDSKTRASKVKCLSIMSCDLIGDTDCGRSNIDIGNRRK